LSDAAADEHEERTLATELQPPPFEGEGHATIYIINLYAVKNRSGSTSEELFQSDLVETVPDILGEDDRAMREISRAFYRNFTFQRQIRQTRCATFRASTLITERQLSANCEYRVIMKTETRREHKKEHRSCRTVGHCSPGDRRRRRRDERKTLTRRPRRIRGGIGRARFQGRQDRSEQQNESAQDETGEGGGAEYDRIGFEAGRAEDKPQEEERLRQV